MFAIIKQARWTILSSVLVLTGLLGMTMFWLFRENVSRKNDLIATLATQVDALKRDIETLKRQPPATTPPSEIQKPLIQTPSKQQAPTTPTKGDRGVKIGDKNQFTNSPVVAGDNTFRK